LLQGSIVGGILAKIGLQGWLRYRFPVDSGCALIVAIEEEARLEPGQARGARREIANIQAHAQREIDWLFT